MTMPIMAKRKGLNDRSNSSPAFEDNETGAIEADVERATARFCGPGALVLRIPQRKEVSVRD